MDSSSSYVAMQGGMTNSPFAKLPAELRNDIWELVFADLWDDTRIALFPNLSSRRRHAGGHHKLSLLLTCKQINSEASPFAWKDVVASLNCGYMLDFVGDYRYAIREGVPPPKTPCWEFFANEPQRTRKSLGARLAAITSLQFTHRSDLTGLLFDIRHKARDSTELPVMDPIGLVEEIMRSLTNLRQLSFDEDQSKDWLANRCSDAAMLSLLSPFLAWTPHVEEIVFHPPGLGRSITVERKAASGVV